MKPTLKPNRKEGFALVVTISMMVLLTVIVVATLSLSAITLRAVDKDAAQAVARANARMALMIAIGHLQKEAGPDQRVTATAEIEGDNPNPYWTGVWKAGKNIGESEPTWLVSGHNPDPDKSLDDVNSAVLVKPLKTQSAKKEIRAPYVEVKGRQLDGRFAYWVGDEGTKVRVDVANPDDKDVQFRERVGRSQSPQEPGFSAFDSDHKKTWAGFDSDYSGAIDRKSLVSMGTVALAAKASGSLEREDIPKYYFNDLTTGGFGLPVNVRDGGMKKDLSLILDSSSSNGSFAKPFVSEFIGATPRTVKPGTASAPNGVVPGTVVYAFADPVRSKFSLSPTITDNHGGGFVGPNWGTLYNYARLWETVSGNTTPMVGMYPRVDSDLRQGNWPPYKENDKGTGYQEDLQHVNSGLSPMMALAQVGLYIKTEAIGSSGRTPYYKMQVVFKPIIGLWNPYNVHIQDAYYRLEWALSPVLDISSSLTSAPTEAIQIGNSNYLPKGGQRVWLREYWTAQDDGSVFPTDAPSSQGGSYFRLLTPVVNFQPGEFRLFSASGVKTMTANNDVVPTLDISGAFVEDVYSIGNNVVLNKKKPLELPPKLAYPAGTRVNVPNASLQDTHRRFAAAIAQKFNGIGLNTPASTWFTLKAGINKNEYTTHLNRYTDLWNGGKGGTDSGTTIPEDVIRPGESYAVDSLTAPRHIATWRFYTRNSTEVEGNQGLRGWIDANPRVLTNNFTMDGSRNTAEGLQGWNFASNMIGSKSDPASGDGGGGNRGLVAEGGNTGSLFPQGTGGDTGRWQGLTGPASTFAGGGLTHVVIYDVPQAPLTSIGQFQHANLSRYPFEPGFVIGNSYANPRVPLNSKINSNFASLGFPVVDTSYEANERIWDTVFFSTLAPDYKGGGSSFDQVFDRQGLILRSKSLPNPRMVYTEIPGDTSIDKVISDAGVYAPQTIATRIMIEGAFNVNSVSKMAWKAVLSTMDGSELPVISQTTANLQPDWTIPKGIRFSRFNHPILNTGYKGGAREDSFWQGWRELSEGELDSLAEAIVQEVKDRGPFRSMAEFVNRDPFSNSISHQYKGALQAAIDNSVNRSIGGSVGGIASNPPGTAYSAVVGGENQAAGHAAYLLQGDILQCLAPIMQVRSDYFRIRTCGEALDKAGKVVARVWCEAFVQRRPEYVDPTDAPEAPFDAPAPGDPDAKDELRSEVNQTFGRRMQLISFRWLNPTEI